MELPESLEETYECMVKDIKKVSHADSYRMLQCLAVAIRPLSVAELAEVLAFDFDASTTKDGIPKLNPKWRWNDHEQAVLSTCSSLVTVCSCMRLSGCSVFTLFGERVFTVGSPRHLG